jgi:NAD-dependent dihydropyrimidine dehydrogenase PreA subunit
MERLASVYVYKIGKDSIIFSKKTGRKEHDILHVKFDEIINMKDIIDMEPNPEIRSTYYFIYNDMKVGCKVCEFKRENKLYRFVFCPSERILRILDRKLDHHGRGRSIKTI